MWLKLNLIWFVFVSVKEVVFVVGIRSDEGGKKKKVMIIGGDGYCGWVSVFYFLK